MAEAMLSVQAVLDHLAHIGLRLGIGGEELGATGLRPLKPVHCAPPPWLAKFTLILAVAYTSGFVSYQLLVRHTFIGWVLNGPRPRKTCADLPAEPSAASA
jgi:hypothetical protein